MKSALLQCATIYARLGMQHVLSLYIMTILYSCTNLLRN